MLPHVRILQQIPDHLLRCGQRGIDTRHSIVEIQNGFGETDGTKNFQVFEEQLCRLIVFPPLQTAEGFDADVIFRLAGCVILCARPVSITDEMPVKAYRRTYFFFQF